MGSCLRSNVYLRNGCKPFGLSLRSSVPLLIPGTPFRMVRGRSAGKASAGEQRLPDRSWSTFRSAISLLFGNHAGAAVCFSLPVFRRSCSNGQYVSSAFRGGGELRLYQQPARYFRHYMQQRMRRNLYRH